MTMNLVEVNDYRQHGLVVIDKRDGVWQTFEKPWWDVFAWLRWTTTPGTKVWLHLKTTDQRTVRVRAVRLSHTYVRMGS